MKLTDCSFLFLPPFFFLFISGSAFLALALRLCHLALCDRSHRHTPILVIRVICYFVRNCRSSRAGFVFLFSRLLSRSFRILPVLSLTLTLTLHLLFLLPLRLSRPYPSYSNQHPPTIQEKKDSNHDNPDTALTPIPPSPDSPSCTPHSLASQARGRKRSFVSSRRRRG